MADDSITHTGAASQGEPTGGDDGQASGDESRQSEIDKIVQARLARAEKSWQKQMQARFDEHAESTIALWREEHGLDDDALEQIKNRDKHAHEIRTIKGEATKARNALAAAQERAERAERYLHGERVDQSILAEAALAANNPKEIVALLRSRVQVDSDSDFSVFVVDDKGEPTGQTVAELVKDYLDANQHHMRPTGGRGAGSVVRGPGSAASSPDHDTREGRLATLRKGGFG